MIMNNNSNTFNNTLINDVAIYTQSNNQQIHFGIANNSTANIIINSNATYINQKLIVTSPVAVNGIMISPALAQAQAQTNSMNIVPFTANIPGFSNSLNSNIFYGSNFIYNNNTSNTIASLTTNSGNTANLAIGNSNIANATLDVNGATIVRSNINVIYGLTLSNSYNSYTITSSGSNVLFPIGSLSSNCINGVLAGVTNVSSQWSNLTGGAIGIIGSNVGIGTYTPAYQLDVTGLNMHRSNMLFSNSTGVVTLSNSSNTLYVNSNLSTNTIYTNYIIVNSNITLSNSTGSNTLYSTNTFIGIGQSTPQATLDINGIVNISSNATIGQITNSSNIKSSGFIGQIWDYSGTMAYGIISQPGPIATSKITGSNIIVSTLSPFFTNSNNTDGSIYFPGTVGNYLTGLPAAIYGTLSSFTMECWINLVAYPAQAYTGGYAYIPYVMGYEVATSGLNYVSFGIGGPSMNKIAFYTGNIGAGCAGSTIIPLNTWTHIACSYNASTSSIQLYINGVADILTMWLSTASSGNGTSTLAFSSQLSVVGACPFTIGQANSVAMNCYISNLRYTQQVLYTAAFTPSTVPLQIIDTTTKLLLRAPLQNRLALNNISKSIAGLNIRSVPSDAIIYADCYGTNIPNLSGSYAPIFDTTQSKSIIFNSSLSQYLQFAPQTFNIATQGFTAICKCSFTGAISAYNTLMFFNSLVSTNNNFLLIARNASANAIYAQMYPNNQSTAINDPLTISQNVIYTIAMRFDPFTNNNGSTNFGVLSIWQNGVMAASTITTYTALDLTLNYVYLGYTCQGGSYFNGDIFTFAAYNRALTDKEIIDSSTLLMSSITSGLPNENSIEIGTSSGKPGLQVKQDGTLSISGPVSCVNNQSYIAIDMGVNKLSVSGAIVGTVGSIQAIGISPFGPNGSEGSLYFNGTTGTYLSFPNLNINNWGLTGITIETWVNVISFTTSGLFTAGNFDVGYNTSGNLYFYYNNGTDINLYSTNTITLNTWNHIAMTWDGTNLRLFINGVVGLTTTLSGTPALQGSVKIGVMNSSTINAYLTNLRVTLGPALYTSSFTPSTTPLTVSSSGSTVLLLRVPQSQGSLQVKQIGGTVVPQAYPPAAMTGVVTNIQNTSYGAGYYIATCSSYTSVPGAYGGFRNGGWQSTNYLYNSTTGAYTGSTTSIDIYGSSYSGEWLQIQLPINIILTYFTITPNASFQTPTTFYILASIDGSNWKCIYQQVGFTSWSSTQTFYVNNTVTYNYYRIVCNAIGTSNNAILYITNWVLYGTESSISITPDGQVGLGVTNPVQALEVANNAIINGQISATNTSMFRNRIINGDMRINQRSSAGTTTNVTTANTSIQQYGADRFAYESYFSSGNMAVTQLTLASTDSPYQYGLQYCVRSQVQGVFTYSYNSTTVQRLEGYNIADFGWGTPAAVPITLSFWFRTNFTANSIYNVAIRAGDLSYSYNLSVTINNQNAWQYVKATIPPPPLTNINWATINGLSGIGMYISFGALSSATGLAGKTTTPNTWQAGNYFGTTAASDYYGALNSYVDITGIQLEKGTIATPFELRPYTLELQLCQRYYEIFSTNSSFNVNNNGMNYNTYTGTNTYNHMIIPFKTVKRAVPTTASGSVAGATGCTAALAYSSNNAYVNITTTTTGQLYWSWTYPIACSCEL